MVCVFFMHLFNHKARKEYAKKRKGKQKAA
jgi:hypothetical protein